MSAYISRLWITGLLLRVKHYSVKIVNNYQVSSINSIAYHLIEPSSEIE